MGNSSQFLVFSAALTLAGLGAGDVLYGRYAENHFVPNMTLQRAEAAGSACLVTLGDSRMAAGIDSPALRDALRAHGVETCVAPLAVGALPISGQAMAMRRLLRDGHTPQWVVLGASAGSLLDEDSPDPSALVGNRAAELAWSEPSDVYRYYPGFPFADLDRGVRFSFARSNALSIYASATWIKAQGLQDRLVRSQPAAPRTRFGALSDMQALFGVFRGAALAALSRSNGDYTLNRWFELVRRLTHERGAQLVVLEVPMTSRYRDEVLDSAAGKRYRDWLVNQLAASGDLFLDLSAPQSVQDQNFSDGIHLDEAGAKAFSDELGVKLAALILQRSVPHAP